MEVFLPEANQVLEPTGLFYEFNHLGFFNDILTFAFLDSLLGKLSGAFEQRVANVLEVMLTSWRETLSGEQQSDGL